MTTLNLTKIVFQFKSNSGQDKILSFSPGCIFIYSDKVPFGLYLGKSGSNFQFLQGDGQWKDYSEAELSDLLGKATIAANGYWTEIK